MRWINVCSIDDLQENSGVCALVGGKQIALFYLSKSVYALNNYDPFGKANVLSRGIIGDLKGQPVVASPLYKQHFNLQTGVCLEDENISIPVYPCQVVSGIVQIGQPE